MMWNSLLAALMAVQVAAFDPNKEADFVAINGAHPEQVVGAMYARQDPPSTSAEIDRAFVLELAAALKADQARAPEQRVVQRDYRFRGGVRRTVRSMERIWLDDGPALIVVRSGWGLRPVTYLICGENAEIADVRSGRWSLRRDLGLKDENCD